jgi:Transposase Tn5 dimerisation domain
VTRWLIEEYHKCLRTGLSADSLQLETANRLLAAISVMAVVAVRLLAMKEGARVEPNASAKASGLSVLELRVLSLVLERELNSVGDVALAVGRLGGHMNRKSDGLPGWQSLWAGMQKLRTLVDGVRLVKELGAFGV